MKIAFTHNLRVSSGEEQAEFDSPETIGRLADALLKLGHDVHLVEVSGRASRLAARLESLRPDLVFNTAEGSHGRYREAFYPALFEQLDLPFTGSDAYVCALTLDKRATKLLVSRQGIATPASYFWDGSQPWEPPDFRFPVLVKPNFEGSSKGITEESVVESRDELEGLVREMLPRYDSGLLVEEFIIGRDVTVPYLAAAGSGGGVLTPASYEFDAAVVARRKWLLYDYELKNDLSDAVSVHVPATVSADVMSQLKAQTAEVVRVLGVRDLARVDFRVTDDGEIFFIEVNALPSLEPGASIYASAADALHHDDEGIVEFVLDLVVRGAAERQGGTGPRPSRSDELTVGLAYNLKRIDPKSGSDIEAEYDSPETVAALRGALESSGYSVVELEATPELLPILAASEVDVVFNIAEGIRGRNREAQIPAILELLDIPYTGSDPATLAITLDKGLSKRLVREAGLRTPRSMLLSDAGEVDGVELTFPVIAKPNAEGSSKGVTSASVCIDRQALEETVRAMTERYRQTVLVEEYLPGREFTIAVLGEHHPRILPPMEIVFDEEAGEHPVYTFGHKIETERGVRYEVPARVEPELAAALAELALRVFEVLGCRDVARIDVRLDANGEPHFIECNPLPGLTPGWSDLCLIAEAAGLDYRSLVAEILAPALRRMRQQRESR